MSDVKVREVYCNARGKYVRVVNEVDHLAAIEQAKIEAVREFVKWLDLHFDERACPIQSAEEYIKELSK